MNIHTLFHEYDITIDDVRWYLCSLMAKKLLEFKEHEFDLTELIWSKKLETDLYNMEEQYIADMQEDLDNKYIDEADVRDICGQVMAIKRKRRDEHTRYT